ncbi:MAG TPA: DUF3135 domain-containing protein [Pseudomonas xinjiangensis]|uniref:DUF3135 domain-containing protein n=2 Tax=root TaxID=1 RepID=A0A7V1BT50_9GAMM|nr:DUF3135 domain-containing protein [Halopseudomonas xinjiangensis]HEC47136.1 DUF3135 domain-containing protein [Halopseudomonas xinjiangensis]
MAQERTKLPSFDELKVMAAERPDELEDLRERMTEEILKDVPEHRRRRLLGLAFRIQMERQRAKNPMHACIRISQMMMDSVVELRDSMRLSDLTVARKAQDVANVIQFKKPGPTIKSPSLR